MIPLPFWLTNIQFVIGAFGVFAFFSAAWLNIDSWAVRRELKTGLRVLGFLLLASWSALHGIGSRVPWVITTSTAILLGGIITILVSYIIDRPPLHPRELAKIKARKEKKNVPAPAHQTKNNKANQLRTK